jgi:hypothetical protein
MFRARHALRAAPAPPAGTLARDPSRRLAARTPRWAIETACGA